MILPVILDWTSDEELLAKAFCSTDIITRPGTRNAEYGTVSYIRARPSMTWLKINRKRTALSTGAPTVCVLTFQNRSTSLYSSVGNPLMSVASLRRRRLRDRAASDPFPRCGCRSCECTRGSARRPHSPSAAVRGLPRCCRARGDGVHREARRSDAGEETGGAHA